MGDKPALKFGRAGLCTDQFVTCAELRSGGVAEWRVAEWKSCGVEELRSGGAEPSGGVEPRGAEWSRVESSGGVEWRSGAEWSRN